MKHYERPDYPILDDALSVLSVEPYGMKPNPGSTIGSAHAPLSVLSVEPYGMKRYPAEDKRGCGFSFSALGRAVWDETAVIYS